MNVFRLDIPNKDGIITNRFVNQVLDYISTWNGDPGLTEIGDNLSHEDFCYELGSFVTQMLDSKAYKDTSRIRGILVFENGMGNFIQGHVFRGGMLTRID